jgi:hypothetical protein
MKKSNKKLLIIIAVVVVLIALVGGGIFAATKMMKKPAPAAPKQSQKKRISDPVNIIDQKDRPFMEVKPIDARNIAVVVNEVKKPATNMDYELEYQTASSLEGLTGVLELGSLPAITKPILLGTCSAGGACRYHENVQGGTLLSKFTGGEQTYALKQEWKYAANSKRETKFSSRDAFFQIESKDLADQKFVIVYNTPGYPGTPTGTVISEAYVISTVSPLKGSATLTMRAKEDVAGAVIAGWDGTAWKEFKGKTDGKSITAQVDLLAVYAVVKK